MKKRCPTQMPELLQLDVDLERDRHRARYRRTLRSTVGTLITVAAGNGDEYIIRIMLYLV